LRSEPDGVSRRFAAVSAVGALLAAPAAAHAAVSLSLTTASATYGGTVTARGAVTPSAGGAGITIAVDGVTVATTTTAGNGSFSVPFTATRGGTVTATDTADSSVSAGVSLAVAPRVTVKIRSVQAFRRGTSQVTVRPATFAGTARLYVLQGADTLSATAFHFSGGRATFTFAPDGYGKLTAAVVLGAVPGLSASTTTGSFSSKGRVIRLGTSGRDVRALLAHLEARGFHTPGPSSRLSRDAQDSIMAFHKAYRRPRTWDFQPTDWRLLLRGPAIRPRHASPPLHIEIDKPRQILLIVKNGKVHAVEHVSTGATGNTPVGRWSILRKNTSTTTWLGSAILYWTMTFHRGFAIHGFAPVPQFPASHGCTREPMWMAKWVYDQSAVGETVFVY
jgi:hypothetical protein